MANHKVFHGGDRAAAVAPYEAGAWGHWPAKDIDADVAYGVSGMYGDASGFLHERILRPQVMTDEPLRAYMSREVVDGDALDVMILPKDSFYRNFQFKVLTAAPADCTATIAIVEIDGTVVQTLATDLALDATGATNVAATGASLLPFGVNRYLRMTLTFGADVDTDEFLAGFGMQINVDGHNANAGGDVITINVK